MGIDSFCQIGALSHWNLRLKPQGRGRNALRHDVDHGRLAAAHGPRDRAGQLVKGVHNFTVTSECTREKVVTGRQQIAAMHAVFTVIAALELALRVPARIIADDDDKRQLSAQLKRQEFRDKLNEAYSSIFPARIDRETVLLAALHALCDNDRAAVVRRRARREFREIESIAQGETLSELHATLGRFINELEDPRGETDILSFAEELGGTRQCTVCSTKFVNAYRFAEAARADKD
jgi:hypothetical protein